MKGKGSKLKLLLFIIMLPMILPARGQDLTEADALIALHKKKFQWMIEKRLDSLDQLLDDQLLYAHSSGNTQTKIDFLDDLRTGKTVYNSITVSDSRVRFFENNTAILFAKANFKVLAEGKPVDVNLYYTEVYIRKNGKWKLASRLATKI